MNYKLIISTLCICLISVYTVAQDDAQAVSITGKVLDADTKEPVSAKIKYESLPYGSKIGVFSGDTFTFNMEDGNEYMLVVRAEGYTAHTSTLKPSEATDGQLEKVVELVPNGINRLIRLDKLIFELGKSNIQPDSYEELNQIVSMLSDSPTMVIQLEGHTDFRGNAKQNMKLSENRVKAVRDYLIKQGSDKKRIRTLAFGGTKPLSKSNDAAARASNRRVEVRILSN